MAIKLHNQGKRTIHFGATPDEVITPGGVAVVNNEVGDSLLRLYPKELVDLDNLTVSYDQTKVKDFSTKRNKPGPKPKVVLDLADSPKEEDKPADGAESSDSEDEEV